MPSQRIPKRPRVEQTCPVCGTVFLTKPSDLEAGKQCCSRTCGYKRRQVPKGHKLPPVVVICVQCGGERKYFGTDRHRGKRYRFCSRDCWNTYIRAHPHSVHHWRGGNSRDVYYGPNWRQQQTATRERDEHTCRDCGHHQQRPLLDVHHVVPFRTFGDDWQSANQLDNLITLCKSCHTTREMALDQELGRESAPPHPQRRRRWGELHYRARLTEVQVAEIRARYSRKLRNSTVLAREFGVAHSTIQAIIDGKTWRHVQPLSL